MKNLIIQHYVVGKPGLDPNRKFEGELPMLVNASSRNVQAYAKRFNADYKMLDGTPFRNNLSYKCQKCAIINAEYDEYDVVIALDTDVFFTKNCNENIFLEKGIGYMGAVQERQIPMISQQFLGAASTQTSFWSGAVYIMDRALRKKLRGILESSPSMENIMKKFDVANVWDEGIFHSLCFQAGVGKVSIDQKWNYDNYLPNPEKCNIIHVRHKPKTRDENYLDLVDNGII